jgi:hypothetical protein
VTLICYALSVVSAMATTLGEIRVHSVQPEIFEFKFSSVVSAHAPATLAFNHTNGDTVFARVGEPVGVYTLREFDRGTGDQGIAVLETADGARFALRMGTPLPQPGHVVCLVSLKNGGWIYSRPGETFSLGGESVTVQLGDANQVTLTTAEASHCPTLLTAAEQQQLRSMRDARRREQEATRQAALEQAEEARKKQQMESILARTKVPQPDARRRTYPSGTVRGRRRSSTTSTFRTGTEYRYPIEYDLVPIVTRTKDGRTITQPAFVPTRFTTRRISFGISTR